MGGACVRTSVGPASVIGGLLVAAACLAPFASADNQSPPDCVTGFGSQCSFGCQAGDVVALVAVGSGSGGWARASCGGIDITCGQPQSNCYATCCTLYADEGTCRTQGSWLAACGAF